MPMPTAKRSSASSEARLSVRKTRLRSGVGLSRYGRLRRMSPNGASGGRASAGARCTSFVATARFMLLVQLTENGVQPRRAAPPADDRERKGKRPAPAAVEQVGVVEVDVDVGRQAPERRARGHPQRVGRG